MADNPPYHPDSAFWQRRQIDNPLRHFALEELDKAAEQVANEIGAPEELFKKAGRLARDPPSWKTVDNLTDEEKHALTHEKVWGFFKQPKMLQATVVTLVSSAIAHGWVQSVSNGANQTMPEYFGLKKTCGNHAWNGRSAIWIFSGINSITYLAAAGFGCWVSDPLQSRFLGRRGGIFVAACICLMSAIGAACATTWWEEMIWRAILGVGLGAKASVTPIFGAEVAPSHLRGTLVMNWQLFVALGIFCGFTANLVCYWTKDLAWRFQIASACIPVSVLLVQIPMVCESPRWLLKKGRVKDAFTALCALRHTPLQAAAELFYAHAQIQMEIDFMRRYPAVQDFEMQVNGHQRAVNNLSNLQYYRNAVASTTYWSRIWQLFRDGRTSRALLASTVVMIGQDLCGVNVLAFYSTVFFRDINRYRSKDLDALWLSWGLGLANFLFTFPAYWGIDYLGRRFLLLATYPGMILSIFGASMSFLSGTDSERSVRAGVFMFFFILFYSLGQGPVAFAYSSEVFPLYNREVGMSWAVFVNLLGAGLLTLFTPLFQVSATFHPSGNNSLLGNSTSSCNATAGFDTLDILSDAFDGPNNWGIRQAKLLGAFVGFGFLSFSLIFFLVPETKLAASNKDSRRTINYISLEELNHIFKVYTKEFVVWQLTEVIPYQFKILKYILGLEKKKPRLPVMHIWASERREERQDPDQRPNGTSRNHDEDATHLDQLQRAYNPSEQPPIRQIHDPEDDDSLALPDPPFQQAERAGSIDWDPNDHPSPSGSAFWSHSDATPSAFARPPSTDERFAEDDTFVPAAVDNNDSPPAPEGPIQHDIPEQRGGHQLALDTGHENPGPATALEREASPQIRRKPVPLPAHSRSRSRTRDGERW